MECFELSVIARHPRPTSRDTVQAFGSQNTQKICYFQWLLLSAYCWNVDLLNVVNSMLSAIIICWKNEQIRIMNTLMTIRIKISSAVYNAALLLHQYEHTLTFHTGFRNAKWFCWYVCTLNNDVAILLSGRSAVDNNLCADSHSDRLRSTDRVRVHVDCWTSCWKDTWKSDSKVVQTIHCSSANQDSLAKHIIISWSMTFNFKYYLHRCNCSSYHRLYACISQGVARRGGWTTGERRRATLWCRLCVYGRHPLTDCPNICHWRLGR